MTQVTIPPALGGDGLPFSDDGTSARDMQGQGYASHFFPMVAQAVAAVQLGVTAAGAIASGSTNTASTTSLAIGTGAKALTVEPGKALVPGMWLLLAYSAAPANNMTGQVTSYNAGTGALVLNVTATNGAGTFADWSGSVTGAPAASVPPAAPAASVPPGVVVFVAASTPPTGYLKANGALINRITYSSLFAAIGTVFGTGDGSTTFKLPDLRGEFVRGWDDARAVDSGRSFGSSQSDQFPSHQHSYLIGTGGTQEGGISGFASQSSYNDYSTGSAGAGTETRPRNIALLACIKY